MELTCAQIVDCLNRGDVTRAREITMAMPLSQSTIVTRWSLFTKAYVEQAVQEYERFARKLAKLQEKFNQKSDWLCYTERVVPNKWKLFTTYKQMLATSCRSLDSWMSTELKIALLRLGPPFPIATEYGKLPSSLAQTASTTARQSEEKKQSNLFDVPSDQASLKEITTAFRSLLTSSDIADIYIGLLFVTGRRQQDLIQAEYTLEDPDASKYGFEVHWKCLAKDRSALSDHTVRAPILASYDEFQPAWDRFVAYVTTHKIERSAQLRHLIRAKIAQIFTVNEVLAKMSEGETQINPHRLRELYVGVAVKTIPHPHECDIKFVSAILGDGLTSCIRYAPKTHNIVSVDE